jgi:hypothetical protein
MAPKIPARIQKVKDKIEVKTKKDEHFFIRIQKNRTKTKTFVIKSNVSSLSTPKMSGRYKDVFD